MTYFFSSDYDGEQCKNGQQFKINVTYGQGLPKSLEEYAPPSQQGSSTSPSPSNSPISGDEDAAPDTIVPSNFNNPHQVDAGGADDDEKSEKSSASSRFVFVGKIYSFLGKYSLVFLASVFLFDLMC